MTLESISQSKVFGGWHKQYNHYSSSLNCNMRFAIFLPANASTNSPVPAMYWLSGLTCTDENFMQKAGAFRKAAELGIAIIAPDTSPRGELVPDDENGDYDFGLGAGFYLDATQAPWNTHYNMETYITQELPSLIEKHFPVSQQRSIAGHSMGGHGALVLGLKHQELYRSISAFSPISSAINSPWGSKALRGYLGNNKQHWLEHDASHLLSKGSTLPILVDMGDADPFLEQQLKPEYLIEATNNRDIDFTLRMQQGYDHSYYFISSFIDDHLQFHHQHLNQ